MRTAAYALASMIAATPVAASDQRWECLGAHIQVHAAFLSLRHITTQEWKCGQTDFKNGKAPPQISLKGNAKWEEGWIDVPGVPSLKTRFRLDGLNASWAWTTAWTPDASIYGNQKQYNHHFFTIFPNGTAEFGRLLTGEKPRTFSYCIAVRTDHQHTAKCLEQAYEHCNTVDLPPRTASETSSQDAGQYHDELMADFS